MKRLNAAMSPAAFLISILALVIATSAGTAYAATKIGTKQLKKNAVTSAKIKDKTIQTRDLAEATVQQFTPKPDNGPQARAYAHVGYSGPALVSGRSRGVASVSRIGTGSYCLTLAPGTGIDLSKVAVSVTVDWSRSLSYDMVAYWQSIVPASCPSNSIGVFTYDRDGGEFELSNYVGFSVVIP